MNEKHPHFLWTVIASLALVALACNFFVNITPSAATAPPTQAAVASPTNPPAPVVENTSAPKATTTQADSQYMADVKYYYEKGYLPYENGELTSLPDFTKAQPSGSVVHDFSRAGVEAQDFALWADIELNTIGVTRYPNYTDCGFAYHVQNNSAGYTAILTNDYVRMGACSSGMYQCELFGTIAGDGKVDVSNKKKTQFSLVVNKERAHALVDGMLVGQYGLFTTKLQGTGDLYYAAVSNYAAGYWTTCQMTNIKLWESHP